jgi:putative hydrolase of the HAD superfamily
MPALILDSGGVLVRPDGDLIAEEAGHLGISVGGEQAVAAVHTADRDLYAHPGRGLSFAAMWATAVGCSPDSGERLWYDVLARIPPVRLWSAANPDAENFLRELSPDVKRYVVTNSEGDAHHELRVCGLRDLIDGVLDSTQVGIKKPDPRIFEMAAIAMGVPLSDCIYISDTLDAPLEHCFEHVLYDPFHVYQGLAELPVSMRVSTFWELPLAYTSESHLEVER